MAGVPYLYLYRSIIQERVLWLERKDQRIKEKALIVDKPQDIMSVSKTMKTANFNEHGQANKHHKRVLFYNPGQFQKIRGIKEMAYLEDCEEKNCELTFDRKALSIADAVIYDFMTLSALPSYTRPKSQVWIHIQLEARLGHQKQIKMNNKVNWTMTYSRHSDIPLPYGMLKPKTKDRQMKKDYLEIARSKSVDAIWVVSHCHTKSKREAYADILKKYIDIDILGACGRQWKCGIRHNHDIQNCFAILNSTYRYYLAFENTLCSGYITEKFFENYDYDILQVVRGGDLKTRPININKHAYISTSDFEDAHALGKYLKNLSQDTSLYANKLKIKDTYTLIHYRELFNKSLCEVCKRLHNLEEYRYVYKNMTNWFLTHQPCFKADDISYNNNKKKRINK